MISKKFGENHVFIFMVAIQTNALNPNPNNFYTWTAKKASEQLQQILRDVHDLFSIILSLIRDPDSGFRIQECGLVNVAPSYGKFSYPDYPALGLASLQGFLQQIRLPVSVELLVEGSCTRNDRNSCIKDTVLSSQKWGGGQEGYQSIRPDFVHNRWFFLDTLKELHR